MHPSLRTFLDLLTRENEIVEIKTEVDPYLELAEVHRLDQVIAARRHRQRRGRAVAGNDVQA